MNQLLLEEKKRKGKKSNSTTKERKRKKLRERNVGIIKASFFPIVSPHINVSPSNLLCNWAYFWSMKGTKLYVLFYFFPQISVWDSSILINWPQLIHIHCCIVLWRYHYLFILVVKVVLFVYLFQSFAPVNISSSIYTPRSRIAGKWTFTT